jgi:hypothetical protein
MMATHAPPDARLELMQKGQKLTYDELRDEVAAAIEDYDGTQTDLADQFDVSKVAVSRAAREAGPSLAKLQTRILEHLRPEYRLEREEQVWYRVHRKEQR